MSACFDDRKVGDRNFAATTASSFDSSTERTSDVSSCYESDDIPDNPCSPNTSGSSWSLRDRIKKKKQYSEVTEKADRKIATMAKTDGLQLDRNLELPPIHKLTINSTPEDEAMPELEDLTLDSDCESLKINKIVDQSLDMDQKPLAGVVTSVAKAVRLIVVKPPIPHDVLLYLGSPVFLQKSSMCPVSKDVKLGWIIDVFGPACEPYYCVKPANNGIELVHEGTQLFYSPEHPRTAFFCLKQEDGNRYTVLYSPRCPLLSDHRSNQLDGKDFWSNASADNSPHRQIHRRRHRSNNHGTYAYRNKYRDDLYSSRPIQPKHSYFNY